METEIMLMKMDLANFTQVSVENLAVYFEVDWKGESVPKRCPFIIHIFVFLIMHTFEACDQQALL